MQTKALCCLWEDREQFEVSFNNKTEQPTEEVQVPEELAKRIFALAELQKKTGQEQELLGD